MDSASSTPPRRLSNLYQYHNAPEVAPAHGLEYDDNVYPVSDKYPVVREIPAYNRKHRYTGKHAFENDNRPPRIIFGMEVRTFLLVTAVVILVVVGAAVGGAVGGKNMHDAEGSDDNGTRQLNITSTSSMAPSTTTPTAATASSSSTFSAAVPTYTALSDCPASNNTNYTSSYASVSPLSSSSHAGLNFTKYCNLESPFTADPQAARISEAFVYSFSDCIEVCAAYNFLNQGGNCTTAVYQPSAKRPGNCWVGSAAKVTLSSLKPAAGIDVALLMQP